MAQKSGGSNSKTNAAGKGGTVAGKPAPVRPAGKSGAGGQPTPVKEVPAESKAGGPVVSTVGGHAVEVRTVPLAALVRAEWNYKNEDDFIQEKLSENLRRNGQLETLLVRRLPDGKFEVVNGNHRLTSLRGIGAETALVLDLGDIPEHEAKRLAIELNETRFPSDMTRLARLLSELKTKYEEPELLRTMPYERKEWDRLATYAEWNWNIKVPELESRVKRANPQAAQVTEILSFSREQADEFHDLLRKLREQSGKTSEVFILEGLRILAGKPSPEFPVDLP